MANKVFFAEGFDGDHLLKSRNWGSRKQKSWFKAEIPKQKAEIGNQFEPLVRLTMVTENRHLFSGFTEKFIGVPPRG